MARPLAAATTTGPVATYPACGSESGYHQHSYRNEVPCHRCCDAHAVAEVSRRLRRGDTPVNPLQYRRALAGQEPAEALVTADRARLVAHLSGAGWALTQIAAHCRMTTYTTARIRDRLAAAGVTAPPTRTHLEESA